MTQEKTSTRHIGAAGELLVQYKLIKLGVDSSRMTTDSGIDLVAYSNKGEKAYTIQVKTKEQPALAGGKGKRALGWFLRNDSPAELIATVDLETDRVWLFTFQQFRELAQQHSEKGNLQLYMYVDRPMRTKHHRAHISQFDEFLLENHINKLFSATDR
jgi:hypothetical protein